MAKYVVTVDCSFQVQVTVDVDHPKRISKEKLAELIEEAVDSLSNEEIVADAEDVGPEVVEFELA